MRIRGLDRRPLRSDIHQEIRSRLLRSEFKAYERLKDTALAEALGTSRTPVREALIRLEREGFLENTVGRGFRVRPLTAKEARDVYPLIWTLETLALESSPPPDSDDLAKLQKLLAAMARPGLGPAARIELDLEWHAVVCGRCPNDHLKKLLEELKAITYRYEYAFMKIDRNTEESAREHHEIFHHLKKREPAKAAKALERHWQSGMKAILRNLETMEKSDEKLSP